MQVHNPSVWAQAVSSSAAQGAERADAGVSMLLQGGVCTAHGQGWNVRTQRHDTLLPCSS